MSASSENATRSASPSSDGTTAGCADEVVGPGAVVPARQGLVRARLRPLLHGRELLGRDVAAVRGLRGRPAPVGSACRRRPCSPRRPGWTRPTRAGTPRRRSSGPARACPGPSRPTEPMASQATSTTATSTARTTVRPAITQHAEYHWRGCPPNGRIGGDTRWHARSERSTPPRATPRSGPSGRLLSAAARRVERDLNAHLAAWDLNHASLPVLVHLSAARSPSASCRRVRRHRADHEPGRRPDGAHRLRRRDAARAGPATLVLTITTPGAPRSPWRRTAAAEALVDPRPVRRAGRRRAAPAARRSSRDRAPDRRRDPG